MKGFYRKGSAQETARQRAFESLLSLCRSARGQQCHGLKEGGSMPLDDSLKRLLREVGRAINDTVAESERITNALAEVRAAGYDIVISLDAKVDLTRRESPLGDTISHDQRFLNSMHIRVEVKEKTPADHELYQPGDSRS
jgi:hypothetical protein